VSASRKIRPDTLVIGGGVAALWTANALKASGRSVVVLSDGPLGSGQSLAAQGVIHGGLKYAVGGKLTEASEALAAMPSRWLSALRGEGPVDLSRAHLLSDHQILWSLPGVISQAVGFFGSKALRGRCEPLARGKHPPVFDDTRYKGRLFRIDEPVVDPVSAIRELARGVADETYLVDWSKNATLLVEDGSLEAIEILEDDSTTTRIEAGLHLLAAGAGNGALLASLGTPSPRMQLRPLHQVIVRKEGLPDFFSVCVGTGPKPPLVATTHRDVAGRTLWYLGGDLAEAAGVARDEAAQIEAAQAFFGKQLPWIDLGGADWFTCRVDRAEPLTGTGDRPPGAYCHRLGKALVAWPTKLALAPALADRVLAECPSPSAEPVPPLILPRPPFGAPPWEQP
jgi:glycerol-3-phosphate dehydrogenase